ncbi:hypothetical protein [Desulfocurvus sp.]|jgi:hypothetical protein|uniref:hypothetical protein n=1 Tax=Desulfocurvus sp. TaxID=2871698 RepID=UPI0025B82977|nr:hypothetical protein [Desulfocurvus sp.]MCK9239837.1 general secretion pathway protein GspB [Desulfocurvus sp.]
MHPGRRSILVRWIAYAVVVVVTAAWLYANQRIDVPQQSGIAERLAPKEVALPPDEVAQTIREAVGALTKKIPNYGAVEKVDPTLVVLDPEVLDDSERYAALSLSALFLGPPAKYAILNGVVYREGAELPDGRVLQGIDADGVTLGKGGETERIEWMPTYRVELKKVAGEPGVRRSAEAEAGTEGEAAPAAQGPAVDLDNLPPDLTPDQALQVLQQMGQQQ